MGKRMLATVDYVTVSFPTCIGVRPSSGSRSIASPHLTVALPLPPPLLLPLLLLFLLLRASVNLCAVLHTYYSSNIIARKIVAGKCVKARIVAVVFPG